MSFEQINRLLINEARNVMKSADSYLNCILVNDNDFI